MKNYTKGGCCLEKKWTFRKKKEVGGVSESCSSTSDDDSTEFSEGDYLHHELNVPTGNYHK